MTEFALPQPLYNHQGEIRKVGVELEFLGMSLLEAAQAVRESFGGELRQAEDKCFRVATPAFGEFEVTFDSPLLRNDGRESGSEPKSSVLGEVVKDAAHAVLRRIGASFLPLEISTPPIPATQLSELAKLESALRQRHAKGTRASPFYAFALHFNPEAAEPANPACLANTLRAFLLLYEWLFREAHIDLTRRLLPFFDPFPKAYVRRVLEPDYAPDMAAFAGDYIGANPTRNRPLDLLPILFYNDPLLKNHPELQSDKVKPRPTFHYRLPNSLLDDPEWSIAKEWNQWVLVERLADNPDWLRSFSRSYLDWDNSLSGYLSDRWIQYVKHEWLPLLRRESHSTYTNSFKHISV